MTSKREIKQAAATLRRELGLKHASRVGKKAIEEAAVGVAANPESLNEVVQWLKVQPKPPASKTAKVLWLVFGSLFVLWMFSGNDAQPSTQQASASSASKPAPAQKTAAQELAETQWADATPDQYKRYCRKGRCQLGGYVLATSKDRGRALVTLGKLGDTNLRYTFALRNPKALGQFGPNYLVGGLICAPPKGKQLAFRNCRINPDHGAPWDTDAERAKQAVRKENRREFSVVVDGYDGNVLIGHEDLPMLGKVTVALTLNNAKAAGRVPRGWIAHVVCFGEPQTLQTNVGTVRARKDCNQLRGERP